MVCSREGNTKSMATFLSEQLIGTTHLNAGLEFINSKPYLGQKPLVRSLESRQLYFRCWGCAAGVPAHYRLLTPHAVKKQGDLQCPICHPAEKIKNTVEVGALEALRHVGLADQLIWQWKPPFWPGRIDFYHYPSGTIIQLDGPPHFEGIRRLKACELLLNDLDFCSSAWFWGGGECRVVRVHDADLPDVCIIRAAMEQEGKFICLSRSFDEVSWMDGGKRLSYYQSLLSKLGASCCSFCTRGGAIWFVPL